MAQEFYIDENGNKIPISGTVNTADMMPMSGNDSTKVSTAIGDLSDLTTTDKSSIVGAVKEVDGKLTKYQDSISANSSKTYTMASDSKIAFVTANIGNGTTFFGVVSFRSGSEIGFSAMSAFGSISVTTSGMTFTVNCTYSTKVTVIMM